MFLMFLIYNQGWKSATTPAVDVPMILFKINYLFSFEIQVYVLQWSTLYKCQNSGQTFNLREAMFLTGTLFVHWTSYTMLA